MAKLAAKDIAIGMKLKMKNSSWVGHGFPQGTMIEVMQIQSAQQILIRNINTGQQTWVNVGALERCTQTVEDIENDVKKYEAKVKEAKAKLDWMKKVNADIYDETEFKVFSTLEALDNKNLSSTEKTKIIASLINNK